MPLSLMQEIEQAMRKNHSDNQQLQVEYTLKFITPAQYRERQIMLDNELEILMKRKKFLMGVK